MQVFIAELSAVTQAPAEAGAQLTVHTDFLESLARQPHSSARCFLLAGPLEREDGGDLDALLKRLEQVQHAAQELGARIDGALILPHGGDTEAARQQAIDDLCARLQIEPDEIKVLPDSMLEAGSGAA